MFCPVLYVYILAMNISSIDGTFMNMSALDQSTPIKHYSADGSGIYRCQTCGYETKRKFNFHRHVQSHSEAPPSLLCATCGKAFKSQKGLMLHLLQNQRAFKYKCKICAKGFNVLAPFKLHLKMHGDAKNIQM